MRVLAISSYGGLGGGELTFSVFLEHRPPAVDAEALLVTDGPLRTKLEDHGIVVRAARGCDGRPNPAMVVRFHRQLSPILRHGRFDVVWAMGQKAALLAALTCRARKVPLVWHKIDFTAERLLARPLALASAGVISVSDAAAESLGGLRRRRPVATVGPPVRLARPVQPAFDETAPTIGTLARLVPYKGHHVMIEAAALLKDSIPGLRLVLAGGPVDAFPGYRAALHALAKERGIEDAVELPGFVDPNSVLERLTVYVNATYRDDEGFGLEGLSGAMLEASAAGLPVVATRSGGTAEGVIDGETGTLVDAGDPRAIADAVRPYLLDPELARRTGARGRRFVEQNFAPETVSRRLWDALAQAAASSS